MRSRDLLFERAPPACELSLWLALEVLEVPPVILFDEPHVADVGLGLIKDHPSFVGLEPSGAQRALPTLNRLPAPAILPEELARWPLGSERNVD